MIDTRVCAIKDLTFCLSARQSSIGETVQGFFRIQICSAGRQQFPSCSFVSCVKLVTFEKKFEGNSSSHISIEEELEGKKTTGKARRASEGQKGIDNR